MSRSAGVRRPEGDVEGYRGDAASGERPRLLLISGPDMDTRIPFMKRLEPDFDIAAAAPDPTLRQDFEDAAIEFLDYPLDRGASPLADLRTLLALCTLIRRWNPDLVHALSSKPAVWGRLAARIVGVPHIVGTLPGQGSLFLSDRPVVKVLRWIYTSLQRIACRVSDVTVVYNRHDERTFVERGILRQEKVRVIPGSGVPTEKYSRARVSNQEVATLREEFGISEESTVVTLIGRVVRTKGVMEYRAAASQLLERHGDLEFLLVGPRDDASVDRLTETEWEELVATITWTGAREDIVTILAATDVFVLPSYAEGIPRALIEAASMGLPLVATRAPGCEDVVDHGSNGLLIDPGDAEQLEAAIERLLSDPDLRREYGEASRRKAEGEFDLDVIIRQTVETYWSLLRPEAEVEAGGGTNQPNGHMR